MSSSLRLPSWMRSWTLSGLVRAAQGAALAVPVATAGLGLSAVATEASRPRARNFRLRLENEWDAHPGFYRAVRARAQRARDQARVEGLDLKRCPDGCETQTLQNALLSLSRSCEEDLTFQDFAICEAPTRKVAKRMKVDESVTRNALVMLEAGGAILRIPRWERAARYDREGWSIYDALEKTHLEAGATEAEARRKATRGAGVHWEQRSTLYVVFLQPIDCWRPNPERLTAEELLGVVLPLRNQPRLIPAVIPVAERRKRETLAGEPWDEEKFLREVATAIEQWNSARAGSSPRTNASSAPGPVHQRPAPSSPASTASPPSAELAAYEVFADAFRATRAEDQRYKGSELAGQAAPAHRPIIGAHFLELVQQVRRQLGDAAPEDATILRELGRLATLAFLKDGNAFVEKQGHKLTHFHGDKVSNLHPCGEAAARRYIKRTSRRLEAPVVPAAAPRRSAAAAILAAAQPDPSPPAAARAAAPSTPATVVDPRAAAARDAARQRALAQGCTAVEAERQAAAAARPFVEAMLGRQQGPPDKP